MIIEPWYLQYSLLLFSWYQKFIKCIFNKSIKEKYSVIIYLQIFYED